MTHGFVFLAALISLLAHELGHYAAARNMNVPVLQVTVGVGPEFFRFGHACNWSIRLLPFGAFVRYANADTLSFTRTAAIVLAGPAANILIGAAFLAGPAVEWHAVIPLEGELFGSYWTAILWLIGGLSLSVGAFNLLPLPPLDGGVLALLVCQKLAGRPLAPRTTWIANAMGALTLALLTTCGLLFACDRLIS